MKLLLSLTLLSLVCANLTFASSIIEVSGGIYSSPPYYSFSQDGLDLDIYETGSDSLTVGETYTFKRLGNATSHPFYISGTNITITGDGSSSLGIFSSQTFTLTINPEFDPSIDTISYFCTAHAVMNGNFRVSNVSTDPKIANSDLFITGNASWPYKYSLATTGDGSDGSEQTFSITITSLPEGGAKFRKARSVANGAFDAFDSVDLIIGLNTLTLSEVPYNRYAMIQFDSGDIGFSSIIHNGTTMYGDGEYAFTAPSGSVLASSEFSSGSGSWPLVYTAVTADDGSASQEAQTFYLNVTALPDGGATYSVYKTTANGNDYIADPVALNEGPNTIPIGGVSFDRAVKLRLSADVAIDQFSLNGNYIVGEDPNTFTAPSGSVLASSEFSSGSGSWPLVYTAVTADDGSASQEAQTFYLNVTALPDGGATYSVYKTTANGNDYIADPVSLIEGLNPITVGAVDFDRVVKLRLSTDVAIDEFSLNGNYIVGSPPLSAPAGSVLASSVFEPGDNTSWPYALTSSYNKGASQQNGVNLLTSASPQHFILNITALPDEGAQYSIARTVNNGNWQFDPAQDLNLGENLISVNGVDFERTVKLRISADVAIDAAGNNGEYIVGENPVQISEATIPGSEGDWYFRTGTPMNSGFFNGSTNTDWPFVYKVSSTPEDGALSQNAHVYVIHVFEKIPGAKASIIRTVANGNWDVIEHELELGWNVIHVRASEFDRSVKFRLSTHLIGFNYFASDRSLDRFVFNNTDMLIRDDNGNLGVHGAAEASSVFDDSDSDGIYDIVDAFPSDSSEFMDADNDGIGSNSDPDDSDPDNPNSANTESPNMSIIVGDNHFLHLSWTPISGTSYTLKSAKTADGTYTTIMSDAQDYLDAQNRLSLGPISGEGVFVGPSNIPLSSDYDIKGFFILEAE